jgi:peptide/nickel transport system substrate-binding protein
MIARPKISRLLLAVSLLTLLWVAGAPRTEAAELILAKGTDVSSFDPGINPTPDAQQVTAMVYDTLIGRDDKMQLKPALAVSWRALEPTVWQIKLRRGVKFHNGEPFDARSVKFTLERLSTPGDKAGGHVLYSSFSGIERVDAVDDLTVNIKTKRSDPILPARLAQTFGAQMIPAEYTKKAGFPGLAKTPIGTGPYKLVSWQKDDRAVFEANRDYWGGAPSIDKVVWRIIPDDLARVSALMAGEVHVIVRVPPDQVEPVGKRSGLAVQRSVANVMNAFIIGGIAKGQGPLSDKRVRQAVAYAIDQKSIIDNLFRGLAVPVGQGSASTDFGYNPDIKPYPYDPAKAKALLAQAGYKGEPIALRSASGYISNDVQIVAAAAEMLNKVGINAKAEVVDIQTRLEMIKSPNVQGLVLANPQGTNFDVDGVLWRLLGPGGILAIHWQGSDPDHEFYKLMEEARYSMDPKKRQANYYRAAEIFAEELPWIPLFQDLATYGVSTKVKGFVPRSDWLVLPQRLGL